MRRLKVDVDLDSGYVIMKMPVRDFREVAVAASLNCHAGVTKERAAVDYGDRALPRLNGAPLTEYAYHEGLLHFIAGIEKLIDMQARPYIYEDPIPLITREVKARRDEVEQARRERQLLDRIIEMALADARSRKGNS